MLCPQCSSEQRFAGGRCERCGYVLTLQGVRRGASASQGLPSNPSLPLAAYAPMRGDVLNNGRYRLIEHVTLPENQHGQGVAWWASDGQSGSRVVLREIVLPKSASVQTVQLIAQRFATIAKHPGFPQVTDVFSERGSHYIVLQPVEGESLAAMIKIQGGALPERTVVQYGLGLCELLMVLERQQPPLVHGSISPETIIVSPDRSHVSLIHMAPFPPRQSGDGNTRTATGSYLAPEQARGMAEPSSDLYAVAATLHHAVTGFDPRERMAFFYPPVRRLNPTVSPTLEAILARQLRLSIHERYANATEMHADLAKLLQSLPLESEGVNALGDPLRLSAEQRREMSRNMSRLDVGIFCAIGVLLLIGFLFAAWVMVGR